MFKTLLTLCLTIFAISTVQAENLPRVEGTPVYKFKHGATLENYCAKALVAVHEIRDRYFHWSNTSAQKGNAVIAEITLTPDKAMAYVSAVESINSCPEKDPHRVCLRVHINGEEGHKIISGTSIKQTCERYIAEIFITS